MKTKKCYCDPLLRFNVRCSFSTVDLDGLVATLSAQPMEAAVDAFVTLECNAYQFANNTEAPIANVTWTQGGTFLSVTQDNKINVTSDTPGEVNFTCTAIDDYGRNATANGTVEFFEDVIEGKICEKFTDKHCHVFMVESTNFR